MCGSIEPTLLGWHINSIPTPLLQTELRRMYDAHAGAVHSVLQAAMSRVHLSAGMLQAVNAVLHELPGQPVLAFLHSCGSGIVPAGQLGSWLDDVASEELARTALDNHPWGLRQVGSMAEIPAGLQAAAQHADAAHHAATRLGQLAIAQQPVAA